MKLLSFEVKKIIRNKSVIILLLLLVIVNVIFGAITKTETKPENYSDTFEKHIEDVIYSAKINYLLIDDKSSEESYYQAEIIRLYEKLYDLDVRGEVRGYSTVLISPYPYLSALVICIYISILLANEEHKSNLILLSYKKVRKKICMSKIVFITITAISTVTVSVLVFFLGNILTNGCSGILCPVQAIPEYIGSPYHFNVLFALLARLLFSILVILIISLCVFIFSVLCKRIIYALMGSFLLLGADYILSLLNDGLFDFYNQINISEFLSDAWLRQYSGMKIFVFMPQLELFAILCVITISTLICFAFLSFRYTHSIKSTGNKKFARNNRTAVKSPIYYEIKKLLPGKTIVLIICLVAAHILLTILTTNVPYRDWEKVYRYSLYQMKDMSYEEQTDYSQRVKNKAYDSIVNAQNIKDLYFDGKETYSNYLAAQQAAGAAELQLSVYETIDEQLMALKALRDDGIEAELVYSTGWKKLFAGEGDIILLGTLIILIIPYITIEHESNYDKILESSFITNERDKRRFERRKIRISLTSSIILIIFFTILDLVVIHVEYGLPSCFSYAAGAGIIFDNVRMRLIESVCLKVIVMSIAAYSFIMIAQFLKKYIRKTLPLIMVFVVWQMVAYALTRILAIFSVLNLLSLFSYKIFYENTYFALTQLVLLLIISAGIYVIQKRREQSAVKIK